MKNELNFPKYDSPEQLKKNPLVKEGTDTRQIYLPEKINQSLLEGQNSPLQNVLTRLEQAGVSQSWIESYRAATLAFFSDRPSNVKNRSSFFRFTPNGEYFSPDIRFSQPNPIAKRFLPHGRQVPRMGTESFREKQSTKEARTPTKPVYQDLLVRINRLMYAFHEPIHVLQNFSTGDLLNSWKTKYNLADVVNPKLEAAFVEKNGFVGQKVLNQEVPNFSVFSPTIETNKREGKRVLTMWLVSNNEATMDILSQQAAAPYLEKQPLLMAWMHNSLCNIYRALKLEKSSLELDGTNTIAPEELEGVEEAFTFLQQAYFSLYKTSSIAKDQLTQKLNQPILNKEVSVELDGEEFDELEFINLFQDVKILGKVVEAQEKGQRLPKITKVRFPSGAEHYADDTEENRHDPITQQGLELAAKCFTSAIKRGATADQIKLVLDQFQDPAKGTEFAVEKIEQLCGIRLEPRDVEEMKGTGSHIFFGELRPDYQTRRLLRGRVFEILEKENPEINNDMIKNCFTEFFNSFPDNEFLELLGMKNFTSKRRRGLSKKPFGWFGLRLSDLDESELQELDMVYDEIKTSRRKKQQLSPERQENIIQRLAKIKRQQQNRDKIREVRAKLV